MRRHWYRIFSFTLMGLLFWLLAEINAGSPRADVSSVRPGDLPENRLVLLEGGTTEANAYGGESRRFTLYWEGGGCLFMPKAAENRLFVNGVERDGLDNRKLRLFQFSDDPRADGLYEVEVRSEGKILSCYGSCVYLGPLPAVSACVSSQIVSRYVVTGICFCVLVFSLVLYTWKRSERYLLWLAMYAFLMLLRTQDALGIGLFVGEDSPLFLALDRFVSTSPLSRLLYQLLAAWLNYQVLRRFLPAKLFGRSIMVYIAAAGLLQTAGTLLPGENLYPELLYFAVLYTCQIVCIQRDCDLPGLEQHILSAAWVLTVVFQIFYTLTSYGVLPTGDIGLQFHIPPIVSCIYIIAFFLVACSRFAIKFQEADDLNAHLEHAIQEKTKEQTAFIRSMLHNLKTPLFSLAGYADMARESLPAPGGDAGRYLDKVAEKAQYVSGLLDRAFLLTQMDANQAVFQRIPVRLGELLRAVEETARLKGKEKGVQVSLSAAPDACCVGDPLYLQQAFQNLADNAVEHADRGGRLDISLESAGEEWSVRFRDDGCGIAPEVLPKIFDRYYSKRPDGRSSSGLGLSIAREIAERHGGSVSAASVPGEGSEFTVTLPKGAPGEERPQPPSGAPKM